MLVEKGELTSGSTWHAAGQVTHSTSSYGLGRMAGYAIELYERIEAETGQSVTFHDCGSLRIAYSDDERDWLRHENPYRLDRTPMRGHHTLTSPQWNAG